MDTIRSNDSCSSGETKKAGFTNIEILDEKLYMELDEGKEDHEKDKLLVFQSRLLKCNGLTKEVI